ncbi:MAG: hypothetical protein ACI4PR_05210 [Acutalibacteraceae bacterium]
MRFFNFRNKNREQENEIRQSDDFLLKSVFKDRYIGEREAMNIPAVSKCVSLIADTVSMIPIKLYKEEFLNGKRKTVDEETGVITSNVNDLSIYVGFGHVVPKLVGGVKNTK